MTRYASKVKTELVKLGYTKENTVELVKKYIKGINHADMMCSLAAQIAFQIALAESGQDNFIEENNK